MLFDIQITSAQAASLGSWVNNGPDMAPVLLRCDSDGLLYVGQGDSRACIDARGNIEEN